MNPRKKYLDYTKGFSIILMCFAHTMSGQNPISTWIFSFHMPVFFIVSGILISNRWSNANPSIDDCVMLCKKRLFQLGIPYFFWGIILAAFYTLLSFISGEDIKIGYYLFRLITFQGINSLWFIPCFFVAEQFTVISLMSEISKRVAWVGVMIIVAYICLCSHNIPELWILRLLLKIFVGFSFTYMGYWLGRMKTAEKLSVRVSIFGVIVGTALALYNGFVAIGSLEFHNGILFYTNALLMSISIISLFYHMEGRNCNLKLLGFLGRDTIVLLCTNNLLIEIIRLIDYKLMGNVLLSLGMLGCLLFTIILLVLEIMAIYISYTRVAIVFGKRRRT